MTEPTRAVALSYDLGDGTLPRVSAKGRGSMADRILAAARAAGVPVREDPDLAMLLDGVPLDRPIPIAAFAAVAEILAQLYRLNERLAKPGAGTPP